MDTTGPKIEAAIDWLTTTWKREGQFSSEHVEACLKVEQVMLAQGNTQEMTVWQGYAGRKTGTFFVGEREDGFICKVSGSAAHHAFTAIYRPDMHVSRLDVQVTAWIGVNSQELGLNALQDARLAKLAGKVKNPVTITHYEDDSGGFTLYLGKRLSKAYARLYNKEAESGDMYYEGAWRYEVELHNQTASSTATELLFGLFPLEEAIVSAVWQYFRSKGVYPSFPNTSAGFEIVLPRRDETTIERSIRWLEGQVKPTVAKLIALGYTSSVLAALGLPGGDTGHNED
jgi:DNA relaxase NicK